jgi:hypothetical protein
VLSGSRAQPPSHDFVNVLLGSSARRTLRLAALHGRDPLASAAAFKPELQHNEVIRKEQQ